MTDYLIPGAILVTGIGLLIWLDTRGRRCPICGRWFDGTTQRNIHQHRTHQDT